MSTSTSKPLFSGLVRSRNLARIALHGAIDNLRFAASLAAPDEAARLEAALECARDAYRALAASQAPPPPRIEADDGDDAAWPTDTVGHAEDGVPR